VRGETFLYVIDGQHAVKVGITSRSVEDRINDFRLAGNVYVELVRAWRFERWSDARSIEVAVHSTLRNSRAFSEWFNCHPFEACDIVEGFIRAMGRARGRNGIPPKARVAPWLLEIHYRAAAETRGVAA
jgi:hypothetical protein